LSASTGIHDYETIIKFLLAGADTVQIASAFYKHGFDLIPEFLKDISVWMKNHNFKSIDEFKGELNKTNLENPSALERVQFMKLYSGIE